MTQVAPAETRTVGAHCRKHTVRRVLFGRPGREMIEISDQDSRYISVVDAGMPDAEINLLCANTTSEATWRDRVLTESDRIVYLFPKPNALP